MVYELFPVHTHSKPSVSGCVSLKRPNGWNQLVSRCYSSDNNANLDKEEDLAKQVLSLYPLGWAVYRNICARGEAAANS